MSPFVRACRLSPALFGAPIIIFMGLGAHGSDTLTHALLLSAALLGVWATAIAIAPRAVLSNTLGPNAPAGIFAGTFLIWGACTALPVEDLPIAARALAHPFSQDLGWRTPAISLAPELTLVTVIGFFGRLAAFMLGSYAGAGARVATVQVVTLLAAIFALVSLNGFGADTSARLDAGLGSPNAAGIVFGGLAIIAVASMARKARRLEVRRLPPTLAWAEGIVRAPLSAACALLCLLCTLLAASRGASAALAAAGVVFFFSLKAAHARNRAGAFQAGGLWALTAAGAVAVVVGAAPLIARLDGAEASMAGRRQLFEAHWRAFLERPWIGHGLGTYHTLNSMVMTPQNYGALRQAGAAHNIFLQTLEEGGVIGFSLLGLTVAALLWRALQSLGKTGIEWPAAALAIAAAFLVHGAVDYALEIPAVSALFAFSLGLLIQPKTRAIGA